MKLGKRHISTSIVAKPESLAAAIERLTDDEAVALPFLAEAARLELLATVRALPFRTAPGKIGEGAREVGQDFDICMAIPADSPLHALRCVTSNVLQTAFALIAPCPLSHKLQFNDVVVQRYAPGSAGISPHRDHLRYVGLVALVPLIGDARFYVCSSRDVIGAREILADPGDLILMRAPGLHGRTDRPFHGLCAVMTERYSIGLRQDSTRNDGEGS